MTINPLVAARLDDPQSAWAGVWIAEDIELIGQGIKNGSWIDTGLGTVGAGLDALAIVSDPVGALLQYGVAWLIEHVEPLRKALDWLAGDPAQIRAHAETWRKVATSLRASGTGLSAGASTGTGDWYGPASTAYQALAGEQSAAVTALANAAGVMADLTEAAGLLVATVRMLVRDAIATLVSRLIVYVVEEIGTLGLATPLVIEQVTSLIAAWSAKIARWLRQLVDSLRRLDSLGRRLGELVTRIKKILSRVGHEIRQLWDRAGHSAPSKVPDPNAKPGGTPTPAHPTKKKDRALRRENESADTLARNGYDVAQNPPGKWSGKNPDYKIEGRYFDNYAPSSKDLDNIRDEISNKVKERQADRVVLNLDDCPRTQAEIEGVLRRKPIQGLKEIIIVRNGQVVPFYPFP